MWYLGRFVVFSGAVLALLLAFSTADVFAQKKKKKGDDAKATADAATPDDYKKIKNTKELTGIVVAMTTSTFTLRVDTPYLEPNPKYKPPKVSTNDPSYQLWKLNQDIMKLQNQLANAKSQKQFADLQQRINNDTNRYNQQLANYYNKQIAKTSTASKNTGDTTNDPYLVKYTSKEYDLDIEDKVEVRKLFLPVEFDDEGNKKTYTDKEKSELRGDDKSKPGYKSKLDEVIAGMEAKLTLTPPPKTTPKKKDDADKDKEKDKDAPKSSSDDEVPRPTIRMITLTKDVPPSTDKAPPEKKKKKDKN